MIKLKENGKTKILFLCHGNICRSTMAEFVMKHKVCEKGLENRFYIDSAGTSVYDVGADVYPETKFKLEEEGIGWEHHKSRQVTVDDYDKFDYLFAAERDNYNYLVKMSKGDPKHKIYMMLHFAGSDRDIADPWYTRNFDDTYDDIVEACEAMLCN